MHIPDGFLNNGSAAGLASVAAVAVSVAVRKVRRAFLEKVPVLKARLATFPNTNTGASISFQTRLSQFGREKVWRMAAVGSLIFSAQMVNFPIGGGTSGHLLGGVLAALVIGPFEALLVMAVILSTQAFVFSDGGLWALGANIFNMGIVGALGGYGYFVWLSRGRREKKQFLTNAFLAAWLSVVAAAVAASVELALSGVRPLSVVLPAMFSVHLIIGLAEGILTATVLATLMKRNYRLAIFEKHEAYDNEAR